MFIFKVFKNFVEILLLYFTHSEKNGYDNIDKENYGTLISLIN